MTSTRTLHTVRAATSLATARPAYAAGLRAAIATVTPLVVDRLLGTGGGTWMSLAGFSVALADRGGPYRVRAATMSAVTLCCALGLMLGSLASNHIGIAIPLTFVVALAASLARVWGVAGASVGGTTLTSYAIAVAFPPASMNEVLARPAFAIAGGLWAMAIALVLWPLQPYKPARLAVAASYRALGDYAESVAQHIEAEAAGVRSELPAGSATVRAALEEARAALAQARRGRPGTSGREQRLVVLGEAVDQLFGHVLAVAETVDSIPRAARLLEADGAIASAIHGLIASVRMLAVAVQAERDAPSVVIEWNGAPLREALPTTSDASNDATIEHYRDAAAILDRAAQYAGVAAQTVAALNDGHAPALPVREPVTEELEERVSPFATLRSVLAPDSVILRYALRVAVITTLAVLLTELLHIKRGYWITITVIVILQPYTGITTQRALQRVIGTVVGAMLTAALGALFHDPRAILVLAFVFAAACIALLPVNYAAFSVFLTPTFVLLAEASAGDWHLAGTRAMNTLLGGVVALLGARLLWPSPEWSRLPGYMATSLRANRDYLRSVVELYADRSEQAGARIRASRRHVGLATVNAEESFQRLLGEFKGAPGDLSPVMTFLTYTRRLTASIAALSLTRHTTAGTSPAALAPFLGTATTVLDDLAASITDARAPAPLPVVAAVDAETPLLVRARVDRLARQIRLLHDAVARWKRD
jgi:uncharacterized membrane protein YccC